MMKRIIYWLAAIGMLTACYREGEIALHDRTRNIESEASKAVCGYADTRVMIFTALQEGEDGGAGSAPTRTTLETDGVHVLWIPGDRINIFHEGCDPAVFTGTDQENVAIATFEGSITTRVITGGNEGSTPDSKYYYGLYPADDAATCVDGVITTTLPSTQKAVAGTFDDDLFITVGRSESTEMPFFNVCSGVKFSLDRDDIRSVTLTADGGEALAGKFSVCFDPETERPVLREVLEGASSITLTPREGKYFQKDIWYYVVTLPQTLQGDGDGGFIFTFTLEGDSAPIRMRSTAPLTLNRSAFRKTAMKVNTFIDTDIETASIRAFLEDPVIDELYTTDMEYSITKGDKISCSAAPVMFNWAATGARTLTISMKEDFSEVVKTASVGDSDSSTGVYNLIPGITYYCRTVSGNTCWETSFVPVGPFRALSVSGVSNARDLGGWMTADGKQVKYGKLFRGAAPSSSSRELLTLGAQVEMDLRGYPGTSGSSSGSSPFGAEFINRPVCQFMYAESSSSGGGGSQSTDTRAGTSADDYQQAIREVIQCLQAGKGVFFHCIGGADRTGTLSWLLLSLLGVDEADLCKEYELTTKRTRNDTEWPFKQLVFYIKTFNTVEDPETGQPVELQTVQEMTERWALTRHANVVEDGTSFDPLTPEEIALLRKLMLE